MIQKNIIGDVCDTSSIYFQIFQVLRNEYFIKVLKIRRLTDVAGVVLVPVVAEVVHDRGCCQPGGCCLAGEGVKTIILKIGHKNAKYNNVDNTGKVTHF